MNSKTIKILGVAASIIGAGATLVSNFVAEKSTDEKIAQKVAEALEKATSKE